MESEWVECVVDNDYEIFTDYPYPIRHKGSDKIISEHVTKRGYVECALNRKTYMKHRIIALQFIPNPDNLPYIDHKDRQKTNNHISNLRWVDNSSNQFNKSSNMKINYEFFEEIPNESEVIEVDEYGNHILENYWFNPVDGFFYFYNNVIYRRLHVCHDKFGRTFVNAYDIEMKRLKIFLNVFMERYDLNVPRPQ